MKLSSLFKGKVYAFPQTQNQEQDLTFAGKVIEKVDPKLDIANISLGKINEIIIYILAYIMLNLGFIN